MCSLESIACGSRSSQAPPRAANYKQGFGGKEIHSFLPACGSCTSKRASFRNMINRLICTCSLSGLFSDPELLSPNIYKILFTSEGGNASAPPRQACGSSVKQKINCVGRFQLDLMPAVIIFNQMEGSLGDTRPSNIGK